MKAGEDQAQGDKDIQVHRSRERPAEKSILILTRPYRSFLLKTYSHKSEAQTHEHQRGDVGEDLIIVVFVWITYIIVFLFILHLHFLLLKHVSEGFLAWESFCVDQPKQEQGPGESQADGEDEAGSLQTIADRVASVVDVVALIFLKQQNAQ